MRVAIIVLRGKVAGERGEESSTLHARVLVLEQIFELHIHLEGLQFNCASRLHRILKWSLTDFGG